MHTVTVSSKWQIVIPKALREAFAIIPGTQFIISANGDEIRLRLSPSVSVTRAADGLGLLARNGRKHLSDTQTKKAIADLILARDRKPDSR